MVLGGPTASGKTSLAIQLAQHYDTEVISGDSRQFYEEMEIGNARPDKEELSAAKHHFVADRSIANPLSAGGFEREGLECLNSIFARNDYAVLTGGSGLYLRALCEGLDKFPDVSEAARTQVQELVEQEGLSGLQAELERLDPEYYAKVDRQNARRLERALQVCYSANRPYSSYLGKRSKRDFRCVYLRLHPERPLLYERINQRVDLMLEAGLEKEARELFRFRHLPVLQTVGYQEWWPYFEGTYDRDRAVELIKQNSRRYAKRQVTWFGRGDVYRAVAGLEEAVGVVAGLNSH
ncbi:tRNA (adenosine(37)-N6)-dimethylallyltransferase MiaA [Neolewinella aurantiaca]|uniref:tRNA (adenosine(37)-N6)-dimethylallyltransferase MiaA n=1 Tax=Neolewinella aurantiaca TaxID=2602767 RepID=UPI0021CE3C92|nr:tRNA (adenosine(37)-N6)-dimethylallyltransferase MiaA [Neolewinella aurantiaca]